MEKFSDQELELMTKVSILYYKKELNQSQIASKFGISRPKVSRLIKKAREKGIVKIKIESPANDNSYLESELAEEFDLKEVLIVDSSAQQPLEIRKEAAAEKALEFLARIAKGGEYIGVSAGTTLYKFAQNAHPMAKKEFKIVPLIGALSDTGKSFNANEISNLLANNLGGINYLLNSPAFLKDAETAEVFKNEKRIKKVIDLYQKIEIAVLGIGRADQSHPLIAGHLKESELEVFKALNLCGSINSIFFNQQGKLVELPFNNRIVAVAEDELLKIKSRIGIAVGSEKKEAVLAALKSPLINILITDLSVAEFLQNQKGVE